MADPELRDHRDARPAGEGGLVVEPVRPARAVPTARPGRSRARWAAALAVTLAAATLASAATVLVTGQAGDPEVLGWTPDGTAAYAEVRLDFPGDQREAAAAFLSAFPGFDDRAAFDRKLTEAFDRILGEATDGRQTWSTDIDPWFGGQVALSVSPPAGDATGPAAHRMLLAASVEDAALASSWAAALLADAGLAPRTETHAGTTVTIVAHEASGKMPAHEVAWAVPGPVALLGDPASVRAALDTAGRGAFAARDDLRRALASLPGDRLALGFADLRALRAAAVAALPSAAPSLPASLDTLTPAWVAASVRAEGGDLVVETRQPHLAVAGEAAGGTARLPGVLPGSTVLLASGRAVGDRIAALLGTLEADPALAERAARVDAALRLLGGVEGATGWLDEAGLAVLRVGDDLHPGLVAIPADADDARRVLEQLRGLVELAGVGSDAGTVVEAREIPYAGTTITVLDLSGLAGLAGTLGAMLPDELEELGRALPELRLAYAVTDGVVAIGLDEAFVEAVLDAPAGPRLADDARFAALLGRAGDRASALVWADAAALRTFAAAAVPAESRSALEGDWMPYLAPLEAVVGTLVPGDDLDRGTFIVHVTR